MQNTKSQGGLFGIVSPEIAYSIIGVLILGVAIVARRIKKSAPKNYSGEELVAPMPTQFQILVKECKQ